MNLSDLYQGLTKQAEEQEKIAAEEDAYGRIMAHAFADELEKQALVGALAKGVGKLVGKGIKARGATASFANKARGATASFANKARGATDSFANKARSAGSETVAKAKQFAKGKVDDWGKQYRAGRLSQTNPALAAAHAARGSRGYTKASPGAVGQNIRNITQNKALQYGTLAGAGGYYLGNKDEDK